MNRLWRHMGSILFDGVCAVAGCASASGLAVAAGGQFPPAVLLDAVVSGMVLNASRRARGA